MLKKNINKFDERTENLKNVDDYIAKKSWKDFEECIINKKLIVFGAGRGAENLLKEKKLNIAYFVDNSELKWGKEISNIKIENPNVLKEENPDSIVVLIASVYIKDISEQLKKMGIKNIFSRTMLNVYNSNFDNRIIKEKDMKSVQEIENILFDDRSREILRKIVFNRNNKIFDYSDVCDFDAEQYFDDSIIVNQENEIFIDGGAFDGETVLKFMDWAKKGYKSIYSYEPIEENFKNVVEKLKDYKNVEVINKALWDKEEILHFNIAGVSSSVDDNGEILVSAGTLEEGVIPTFIKLDVEGSEMNVLHGMENIIKNNKPKLAICLYHLYDDLWKIPAYIHELVPEYKLYIRHYSPVFTETVLYAVL